MNSLATEQIQKRKVKARLRMRSMRSACACAATSVRPAGFFGVCRALFCTWKPCYEKHGAASLRGQLTCPPFLVQS
jgi:hypothetical protein